MNAMKAMGLTVFVLGVVGVAYYLSRPTYPKISPKAYEYATALYSASNQQATEKLDVLTQLIDRSRSEGEIDVKESRWLHAIIDQSRSGRWQKANAECRVLLECQVDKDTGPTVESMH